MPDNGKQPSGEDVANAMTGIFDSILGEYRHKAEARLAERAADPEVVKAEAALRIYDYEGFGRSYLRPHQDMTEALISKALSENHKLEFILMHQDFVGAHLQHLFETYEGRACCADKERTVMRALIRSFHKGTEIKFDYDGEYTYHLPSVVLRDHDGIMSYFDSLHQLFYGRPETYIEEISKIIRLTAASKNGGAPGMSGTRIDISASTGTLDVSYGHGQLARHLGPDAKRVKSRRVPVLISGFIDGVNDEHEGDTRSFSLEVSDLHVGADFKVVHAHERKTGSPFELTAGEVERLDGLAESTLEMGQGYLASAEYHAQGRVSVPSHWLRELVSAYRAIHPEAAPYYFSISTAVIDDEDVFEVTIVGKDHWERHGEIERRSLAEELDGRIPAGGAEIRPGVFAYSLDRNDDLRVSLYDAGLREKPEVKEEP